MNLSDVLKEEGLTLNTQGFAYQNLIGVDTWDAWTPVLVNLTIVGTPTYTGRWKRMGHTCFVQAEIFAATSIQTNAGVAYMELPIAATGVAGMFVCSDATTKAGTGVCWLDQTNSRVYLPSITPASADHFDIAGWYEV